MTNTNSRNSYSVDEYSRTYSGILPPILWTPVDDKTVIIRSRTLFYDNSRTIIKVGEEFIEVDQDQMWFWTPQWQQDYAEAKREIAEGLGESFDSMDDFINSLFD